MHNSFKSQFKGMFFDIIDLTIKKEKIFLSIYSHTHAHANTCNGPMQIPYEEEHL